VLKWTLEVLRAPMAPHPGKSPINQAAHRTPAPSRSEAARTTWRLAPSWNHHPRNQRMLRPKAAPASNPMRNQAVCETDDRDDACH
jgi:hypothetical protein